MSRNRETNRAKVSAAKKEEGLDSKNAWGISDPTPKKAVENIIAERRVNGNKGL